MSRQSNRNNKESFWVQVYLAVLFLCGIALWFSLEEGRSFDGEVQSLRTARAALTQGVRRNIARRPGSEIEITEEYSYGAKISNFDLELEQAVQDALVENGIDQTRILAQYARQQSRGDDIWIQFHRTVSIPRNARTDRFEQSFSQVARRLNTGLRKNINADRSVTYTFFSNRYDRIYSTITFAWQN